MVTLGILSLGGTITMAPGPEGGVIPELTAEDICSALPQLNQLAHVKSRTLRTIGSPSLTMEDLYSVCDVIVHWHQTEAITSFVILQGTDTLEESAFAIDLMLAHLNLNIVFTAAMRDPHQLGADGFANLLASARVALHAATAEMGVVVVINDEIHAARLVEKRHSFNLRAFQSPNLGAVGWIVEGRARYVSAPSRLHIKYSGGRTSAKVALIRCVFDMDSILLDSLPSLGYDAVVIEGVGGGNVAEALSRSVAKLASQVPTVLVSRTGGGEVLSSSYGEVGSAGGLLRLGCINGTTLDGLKARVMLLVLLADGASLARIRDAFAAMGDLYLQ